MQPFQYDLRSSAAKDNSITHAAAAPSNLDAATTMRSAETELQNTIELRAMASEIAAPKPARRQSDKKTILKHFLKGILKGNLLAPKLRKSADKSLSQPWCSHSNTIYDLQLAKDNSITHAAAAPSNLDAATTMRSAEIELQNTIELRAMVLEIAAPKPDGSRRQSDKKTILKHFLKGILKGNLLAPKLRKSADKSLSQPWCSHSNTIYDLQLQKTIVLRMQPQHRATLTQPLQCVSQHPVANLHLSTDVATPNDNNHAAIPMRSATTASRNA